MSTSLLSDAERRKTGLSPALVRMSVGLEDVEDLLADIDQALEAAVRPPAV
jgi:cystathionine beta-lyase/cystathionine gamma-synthase